MDRQLRSFVALLLALLLGVNNITLAQDAQQQIPNLLGKIGKFTSPKAAVETAIGALLVKELNNTLPLKLDARHALTTVSNDALPGGAFHGKPLDLTADTLFKPLPSGDWFIPLIGFCEAHGTSSPGKGMTYTLAEPEGKNAQLIASLVWRGVLVGKPVTELQAIDWAIEAGITYTQMNPVYQHDIDQLVPEFKGQLQGSFVEQISGKYNMYAAHPAAVLKQFGYAFPVARFLIVPTLPELLQKMGATGQVTLQAMAMEKTFLAANMTEEMRQQVLFQGQPQAPALAQPQEGAWSIKAPNVYVRLKITHGYMNENLLQIRVLPPAGTSAHAQLHDARLVYASYQETGVAVTQQAPTLFGLLGVAVDQVAFETAVSRITLAGETALAPEVLLAIALSMTISGMIGYPQGRAAQPFILTVPPSILLPIILQMAKQSKQSGKEKSSEYPSWVDYYPPPDPNEKCGDFAQKLLNDKYGVGSNKATQKGGGSEYSQIKKACERGGLRQQREQE